MNLILKFLKISLIAFFVSALFFLFYKDFVPSGRLVIINDFRSKSKLIFDLEPAVRLRKIRADRQGNFYQAIFIDPVYFNVNSPRFFEKAKVKIIYKNKNQPLFQLGLKQDAASWNFDFRTLEFQKIDNLDWHRLQSGNLLLLQKSKQYETIEDFLRQPPTKGRIASYNYEPDWPNSGQYLLTTLNSQTDLDHVSYIIANYLPPSFNDDYKIVEAEFPVSRAMLDAGKLNFMFSAPEIDLNKIQIDIYEIKVTLEREPVTTRNLWRELYEYFKDAALNFVHKNQ